MEHMQIWIETCCYFGELEVVSHLFEFSLAFGSQLRHQNLHARPEEVIRMSQHCIINMNTYHALSIPESDGECYTAAWFDALHRVRRQLDILGRVIPPTNDD